MPINSWDTIRVELLALIRGTKETLSKMERGEMLHTPEEYTFMGKQLIRLAKAEHLIFNKYQRTDKNFRQPLA